MGAYIPPNDMPAVYQVEQVLTAKPPGIDTILMGDLNARLEDPRNNGKDDLVTALANHGLEDACRNFTQRGWYRGRGRWTCNMKLERRQVTGRG